MTPNFSTTQEVTWCPGCPNFMILSAVKKTLEKLGQQDKGKYKPENFSMTTGIGCHAKMFDYLNISGIYCLHGRPVATGLGIKLGNPNLNVIAFAGDGDTYAEGISHFVHACRYNANMNLIVHDNRAFSLTTGQATPTSQIGFKTKAEPLGEMNIPLNPVKLALASGCSFIARTNARDMKHMQEVFEKAIKHKGFSFVEVLQDCLIFNKASNNLDKLMYKVEDNLDKEQAEKLASEWDYNSKGKIPIGVLFQEERSVLEEQWFQLKGLVEGGVGWKGKK